MDNAKRFKSIRNQQKKIEMWRKRIERNRKVIDTAQRLIASAQESIRKAECSISKNMDAINGVKKPKATSAKRNWTLHPLTYHEAYEMAHRDLDRVYSFDEAYDYFEAIGSTGGDARHLRYYKNGMRCEK